MATPVEPRNFVSVVPAAKKGKLGPIFFLNIRVMYILSVKKQKTGQKTGKNSPKKVFFFSPPDQLAEFGQILTGQNPFEQILIDQNLFKRILLNEYLCVGSTTILQCVYQIFNELNLFKQILTGQNLFKRILTGSKSVQTQPADRRGWKNHLFWRVFARFLSSSLLFH